MDGTRREFLKDLGRWTLAGIITGGAIFMGRRAQKCSLQTPCKICNRLGNCNDARAIATRAETDLQKQVKRHG